MTTSRTSLLGDGSGLGLVTLSLGLWGGRGRLILLPLSFLWSSRRGRSSRGRLVLLALSLLGSSWGGLILFSFALLGGGGSRRGSWGGLVVLALALLGILGVLDGNACLDLAEFVGSLCMQKGQWLVLEMDLFMVVLG